MIQEQSVLIYIDTNVDLTGASRIEVAFSQKGKLQFVKTGGAVTASSTGIVVEITKEEAMVFEPERLVAFDVTAFYDGDTTISSNVMYRAFERNVSGDFKDVHVDAKFNDDGLIATEKIRDEFDDIADALDAINGEVI